MKTSSILIITAFLLSPLITEAQFKATAVAPQPSPILTEGKNEHQSTFSIPEKLRLEPLSVKKVYVEGQLKNVLAQLTAIHTRTQLAVDRLTEKKVATFEAQNDLDRAALALNDARLTIDAIIATEAPKEVDRPKVLSVTASLKEQVKKTEESLQIARLAMMESLVTLKSALVQSLTK